MYDKFNFIISRYRLGKCYCYYITYNFIPNAAASSIEKAMFSQKVRRLLNIYTYRKTTSTLSGGGLSVRFIL